ncbi:DUF6777 domain-containing protein [Streptomyces shaanxiensis]|uniref:DUF6777 domain-containing protein n=1 Tax=Streptomyces shaanxiensis TaxID=653357 RepID=A0ABP7WA65_9ACTN
MPENRREGVVRTSTGAIVTTCALSTVLFVAGCGSGGDKATEADREVLLEPAASKGPDPFTDSTATAPAAPSPVTRTPQPAQSGLTGPQHLSGGTPGLYGGTRGTGSCDVRRQIDRLTSDEVRGRVFAAASGITQASIPAYLRGLTSVVLRADTRVTNHGFRDGRGTGYQSVLQAGTAVLVDGHGVPRVRCACGNPLAPAVALPGGPGDPGTGGRSWSGYRPDRVVVVAPTNQVITNITIINIADNTWIERPVGHRGHDRDHVLPRPKPVSPTAVPRPDPHDGDSPGEDGGFPTDGSTSPSGGSTSPEGLPTDCVTPTAPAVPGVTEDTLTEIASDTADPPKRPDTSNGRGTDPADCPTATATPSHPTTDPGRTPASPEEPGAPETGTEPKPSPKSPDAPDSPDSPATPDSPAASESSEQTGPEAVPESPDRPDGGGLIPDEPRTTDSVFGSPTDVFDG